MRRLYFVVSALVLALSGGVTVAAWGGGGSGDTLTGCLGPGGVITAVAIGDEPLSQCERNQVEVSWSKGVSPEEFTQLAERVAQLEEQSTPSKAFSTGALETTFEPGDPAVDLMALDLPAGDYVFYVTMHAIPEALFDPDGKPIGFAPGGVVECRFFEEAADGTRRDLTEVKHGVFGATAVGTFPLREPGADAPFVQSAWDANYVWTHGDHPDDTTVVAVCQHTFGEQIRVQASWVAVSVDTWEPVPPL